ncbi:unnamed protein product [Sphenostylis stenocarpa]|uniref:Uncharacterized protein n=1 Tax=Sphenostylis stenocarpa TaxID=92480 RepID=A0AA86V8S9_9FABA|nr:unnamed protein product [Sphenostylis stenocarpa]
MHDDIVGTKWTKTSGQSQNVGTCFAGWRSEPNKPLSFFPLSQSLRQSNLGFNPSLSHQNLLLLVLKQGKMAMFCR